MAASALIPAADANLAARFQELTSLWRSEIRFYSDTPRIILHPAYQQIIGMGREALPLILARVERGEAHWSWALISITGEGASPIGAEGDLDATRTAWLGWARQRGITIADG